MEIREYRTYQEAEILHLYASVGWSAYTAQPEALRRGFENSLLTLAAYEGDQLIGILRAVGDGHTVVLIQDILILPEHQRCGVGSALMQALLERYGDVRQIKLATDATPQSIAFYESVGFRQMTEFGCCGFMKV